MSREPLPTPKADRDELRLVVCCFTALFFLLLSYYLIKPLRNSQFLKDFPASYLPFVYLVIPILSLAVTKVYNWFCDRMDKFKLIIRVYLVIMGCKIAFTWLLASGQKWATVAFYFWGSVYFLLALATLWACFNDFFTCDQGERFYGLIATGAVSGNILGAKLSSWIARSDEWRPYATLVSASSMAIALFFLMLGMRFRKPKVQKPLIPAEGDHELREEGGTVTVPLGGRPEIQRSFWSDVRLLFKLPYVRGIAIMVCFLATYTTTVDFLSQKVIDLRMAEREYMTHFQNYNDKLNGSAGGPMNKQGFEFIYGLKLKSKADVPAALQAEGQKHGMDLEPLYKTYQDDLESETRATFSDIFLYQGVVGVILLVLVSRFIFKKIGLTFGVLIMPTFAVVTLIAFAFPLELFAVELMLVFSGALNYSLNNASKEILYTATDEETKFKLKPLIEGPGMRTGDITASILSIGTMGAAAAMGWQSGDKVFLLITFAAVVTWWFAIRRSGRIYDTQRRLEDK